jgi:hypothetical protein
MSTGWAIFCLILGVSVVCLWAYFAGRGNGYRDGHATGITAGRQAEQYRSAQRLSELSRQLDQALGQGRTAQEAIDYLYTQAGLAIEQIDSPHTRPVRGGQL